MARWKLLAGKFYLRGKRHTAGDIFEATASEIKGIRDIVEPLDRVEDYEEPSPEDVPRKKLEAVHRGHGHWDVINIETNETVNDHSLTKMDAKKLVDSLLDLEAEQAAHEAEKAKVEKPKSTPKKKPVAKKPAAEAKKVDTGAKAKKATGESAKDKSAAGDKSAEKAPGDSEAVGKKHRVPIGRGTEPE